MAGKPKSHHEDTKNSFLYPLEGYTKKSETKKSIDIIPGNWIQEREERGTPSW
jgi:hypothetical protein